MGEGPSGHTLGTSILFQGPIATGQTHSCHSMSTWPFFHLLCRFRMVLQKCDCEHKGQVIRTQILNFELLILFPEFLCSAPSAPSRSHSLFIDPGHPEQHWSYTWVCGRPVLPGEGLQDLQDCRAGCLPPLSTVDPRYEGDHLIPPLQISYCATWTFGSELNSADHWLGLSPVLPNLGIRR